MSDDACALLARRVEEHLAANPVEGVSLRLLSVTDGEDGILVSLGVDAPMRMGDTRVPEAVNAALTAALRAEPSLRGRRVSVQVDVAA